MVPGQRGLHPGVIDASESTDATPERWLAISVRAGSPIVSELLIEALLGLGARGVQEADGRLITYVPPPADPEAFVQRARAVLGKAAGLDDVDLKWCWQDHGDWSVLWRQGLGPRAVTDRLVIPQAGVRPMLPGTRLWSQSTPALRSVPPNMRRRGERSG